MAFFPISPTDGQQANVGNILYQWSAATGAWNRVGTTVIPLIDGSLVSISGNLTVSGTGTSLFNGRLNVIGNIVSGANITGATISSTGNISAGANISAANVNTTGLVSAVEANISGPVTATGNISSGAFLVGNNAVILNLTRSKDYSATGNVTVDGNIAGGGRISVAGNVLAGENISAIGNVSGQFFVGNGALLTGINTSTTQITNGSSNLAIATSGGNIAATVAGNANVVVITADSLRVNGFISATGNATVPYYFGNGAFLTGLGGSTTATRSNVTVTTGSLANAASFTGSFAAALGYYVYKITVDQPSWVRLYTSVAAQSADSGRTIGTLPSATSGLVTEVIATTAGSVVISPAAVGFSDEATPTNQVPVTITNISGGANTISATVTYVNSEPAPLNARANVAISTTSIANAATFNGTVTMSRGYNLLKITTSAASWVRVYTNVAARTADASRSQTTDPQPGAGVIAEAISTGAQSVVISPGSTGWNDEATPDSTIPVAITNLSGSTGVITATFTYIPVEL